MGTDVTFETRPPRRFGMWEVLIVNVLGFLPSFAAGGLFGGGCAGIPLAATVAFIFNISFWIVLIPLCFLALGMLMFLLMPALMFANYYVTHLVSNLRSHCGADSVVCQLTTHPRTCRGVRAFLEDADDVGLLSIQDGSLRFTGDHSELTVDLSGDVRAELCNAGWRGLWFASRRIRLILSGEKEINAMDLMERQCWTVVQSRRLMTQVFETIRENTDRH